MLLRFSTDRRRPDQGSRGLRRNPVGPFGRAGNRDHLHFRRFLVNCGMDVAPGPSPSFSRCSARTRRNCGGGCRIAYRLRIRGARRAGPGFRCRSGNSPSRKLFARRIRPFRPARGALRGRLSTMLGCKVDLIEEPVIRPQLREAIGREGVRAYLLKTPPCAEALAPGPPWLSMRALGNVLRHLTTRSTRLGSGDRYARPAIGEKRGLSEPRAIATVTGPGARPYTGAAEPARRFYSVNGRIRRSGFHTPDLAAARPVSLARPGCRTRSG